MTSRRRLRSSASHRLEVPPVRLSTVSKRAFPVSGANMWNDLPFHFTSTQSLAVFRQRLKTFLFSRSYPNILIWLTYIIDYRCFPAPLCLAFPVDRALIDLHVKQFDVDDNDDELLCRQEAQFARRCVQCEGVFVTVTMAVSTVSVMESIIVMRLCSIQSTRMPSVVRFVAFRLVGRALCVTRSPTSSTKHHRDRGEKNDCQENPDLQESLLGDTAMSDVAKNRSELLDKINDVLVELRKVRSYNSSSFPVFFALFCSIHKLLRHFKHRSVI